MHKLIPVLLGTIILIALAGCGQKGPLYLPDGSEAAVPVESGPEEEEENGTSA